MVLPGIFILVLSSVNYLSGGIRRMTTLVYIPFYFYTLTRTGICYLGPCDYSQKSTDQSRNGCCSTLVTSSHLPLLLFYFDQWWAMGIVSPIIQAYVNLDSDPTYTLYRNLQTIKKCVSFTYNCL